MDDDPVRHELPRTFSIRSDRDAKAGQRHHICSSRPADRVSRLDYHLYAFELGGRRFEAPDPEAEYETEDSTAIRLRDLKLRAGAQFTYVYDFGDDWQHDVVVERQLPMPSPAGPGWSPRLLDGERAAPPEDAGGPRGFAEMLQAFGDPDHPEHDAYRQWAGAGYDPDRFDAWSLDHALALVVAWGGI